VMLERGSDSEYDMEGDLQYHFAYLKETIAALFALEGWAIVVSEKYSEPTTTTDQIINGRDDRDCDLQNL